MAKQQQSTRWIKGMIRLEAHIGKHAGGRLKEFKDLEGQLLQKIHEKRLYSDRRSQQENEAARQERIQLFTKLRALAKNVGTDFDKLCK